MAGSVAFFIVGIIVGGIIGFNLSDFISIKINKPKEKETKKTEEVKDR